MQLALTVVGPERDALAFGQSRILAALKDVRARVKEPRPLGEAAVDLILDAAELAEVRTAALQAVEGAPVDVVVQPLEGRRKRLFVADMDSTIIGCECLDELADYAGKKAEIAAITERAMRGELEFEGALRERVAMLKGLSVMALQSAYDERVRLNPGARTLVRTMAADGTRCLLVSGGFTFFTLRVAEAAGFHAQRANTLGEGEGALTGLVGEPILGREAKLAALTEEAAALGLDLSATMAVGDGANDLAMIKAAGLGVAYRAKPIVAAEADAKVDFADLTALLYFQGYRAEEFVTD
ncbi:phosphoserine phosphatase SerB [Phenylobacterium sp.]|jgi:phosphoserine phosphatase|uniref:phosphoserine phosphatase SerB n=1 Tax=Phenylobacterium sp. TaxID=1871053 RepID=UPI002E2FB7DF|nr:phosphoserine phosphatase SerB [Phenylobacterium sp.]HEX2561148.1 phosphoserine phosphatase SerB [Phenylobacterium sp.]